MTTIVSTNVNDSLNQPFQVQTDNNINGKKRFRSRSIPSSFPPPDLTDLGLATKEAGEKKTKSEHVSFSSCSSYSCIEFIDLTLMT